MKRKIIVLGIIILLIGVIAPQSGAVQELDEQQNQLQAPMKEGTYGPFMFAEIIIYDNDLQDITYESQRAFGNIHFNVKINVTITGDAAILPLTKFLGLRSLHFREGDKVTIECPIARLEYRIENNLVDLAGEGLFVKATVISAPEY